MKLLNGLLTLLDELLAALCGYRQKRPDHKALEERFWQRSLVLTFVAILLATAAFIASALQARYARQQAFYAQQQLSELRAENRPWIATTPILKGDFNYAGIFNSIGSPDGGYVSIWLKQANEGHMPALDLTSKTFMLPMTGKHSSGALPELEVLCNENPSAIYSHPDYSEVVFPGYNWGPILTLNGHDNRIDPKTLTRQLYVIYGCTYYAYGDPISYHHSAFQYELGEIDPKYPDEVSPMLIGPTIPEAKLRLQPLPVGGDLIN